MWFLKHIDPITQVDERFKLITCNDCNTHKHKILRKILRIFSSKLISFLYIREKK